MCAQRGRKTPGICAALAAMLLAGCGLSGSPQIAVTETLMGEGTSSVRLATEAPTAVSELPTAPPTSMSDLTPSPRPPTSAPTPTWTAPPDTPAPTPTATPSAPPPSPTPVPTREALHYEDRSGPSGLLASYYNAINRRDYARAWGYWDSPPNPSYEAFVRGFADTASVRLTVRPPTWFGVAAGSTYARVPALLSATHHDGSWHNFVGCFVARRSNVEGLVVDQGWTLHEATVRPTPSNSADALLLLEACDPTPQVGYEERGGPVRLLASYYNAVNQGDYARAWDYWETPPAASLEAFAQGFADTESVLLVLRPPTFLEGAAGSVYTAIPALLSATHHDGSRHNFVGCFVARRPNVGPPDVKKAWSLYDATIYRAPGNVSEVTLLDQACAVE